MKCRDPKTGEVHDSIQTAQVIFCATHGKDCRQCFLRKFIGNGPCFTWCNEHPKEAAHLMGYEVTDNSSTEITEIDETPTDSTTTLDDTPTVSGDTPTKEDDMDKQDGQTGLRVKYEVKKVETGEVVNNCFVLRPDRDPAAVAALQVYARVTPNKALANDIMAWVGANTADKPRLAEVLGVEVGEQIRIVGGGWSTGAFSISMNGYDDLPFREIVWAINHPESIIRAPRLTEPEIAIMRAMGAKWVSRDVGDTLGWVQLWDEKPKEEDGIYYVGKNSNAPDRLNAGKFPSVHPGDLVEVPE